LVEETPSRASGNIYFKIIAAAVGAQWLFSG
jgi:hypothetical protein